MAKYKLTYIDVRARGETSRMLFKLAGVDFEDLRIEGFLDPKVRDPYKKDSPFGQFPILEVDGKKICQSHGIERYLAREFGFDGKTNWDKARADMVVGCLDDTVLPLYEIAQKKDPEKKKLIRQKYVDETFPEHMANFEKMLIENNGGDGFFAGEELTYADLAFINFYKWPEFITQQKIDFSLWPKLKALVEKVEAIPVIAEWMKIRPKGQFDF